MEITLDTLINILSLLLGGGGGAFFVWRYQRRKAKAEASQAEVTAAKEMQDMYQQMIQDKNQETEDNKRLISELREDRDHYKQERNDLRDRVEKLQKSIFEWKDMAEADRSDMKRTIARLGRRVDAMAPFICGDLQCKHRQRVAISDIEAGDITIRPELPASIEPNNEEL